MSVITATAVGISGIRYEYEAYPINSNWNAVAGNYMFAYHSNGQWNVLYIGQTNDYKARFANHHKLPLAIRYGATHILVRRNDNAYARANEERDLIASHSPSLNDLQP